MRFERVPASGGTIADRSTPDRPEVDQASLSLTDSLVAPVPAFEHDAALAESVRNLRALLLAGEHYRQAVAASIGLGTTESQAISYLAVHGDRGQSDLARDLRLTSSASTALVDRLERQGVATRTRHPRDRRRTIVQLTDRGQRMVDESQRWLGRSLERLDPSGLEIVARALTTIADDLAIVAQRVAAGEIDAVATHALPAA